MIKEQINKRFEILQKRYDVFNEMVDYLPRELTEDATICIMFNDLRKHIAYDIKELRKTRKLLGKGWKMRQTWGDAKEHYAYRNFAFTNSLFPNVEFEIHMETTKEGSTCKVEKMGEETKNIYKVVCS